MISLLEDKNHNSFSADPPTTYLTFAYWIYMVPQYKPKDVLILGYGGGTVAGLIRLLYGDVPITGVDIKDYGDKYGVDFIKADAREFIKTCRQFDTVIVDLFSTDISCNPCDFVASEEFVLDLERVANYLIVNGLHTDMTAYKRFRKMGINKASGSAEQIYYFEVNDPIPDLHPWK
jgi:hypothetical protein